MRAIVLGLIAALAIGCTPSVQSEAYLCGTEGLCPPGLACDPTAVLCVLPEQVEPFTCTPGPQLPPVACGSVGETRDCLLDPGTHIHYAVTVPAGCATDLEVRVFYPIALMPVALAVHDASGALVATGAPCGDIGENQTAVCVDIPATAGATYDLDVSAQMPLVECPTCGANRFALSVALVSS